MRLVWLTDIHFPFLNHSQREEFCASIGVARPDVVLVTGDISSAKRFGEDLRILSEHANRADIFFVLGNHDYYGCESIETTRKLARGFADVAHIYYLPECAPVKLTKDVTLVGIDGWGDARNGNVEFTQLLLNDFVYIPELTGKSRFIRNAILNAYGENEAAALEQQLSQVGVAREVIIATHVPPFMEACVGGDRDGLPFFSCRSTGEAISRFMINNKTKCTVLCGHTHYEADVDVHGIHVCVGGAEYGAPKIQKILCI
jgi:3',5'-cyclic-AMP phosphodiesterase